ncbi:MAG: LysM domain-containing protein [Pseudomonadota bacterium]
MAIDFMKALIQSRNVLHKVLALSLAAALLLAGVEAAEQTGEIAVRADSPQSYTVQQGDTLWDIAGRFLEQPWLWPQVWQVNPQIQNPDLIYPGDTISLSYQNGQPVLSLSRNGESTFAANTASSLPPSAEGIRTERRSPQVRRENLLSPIPAIPLDRVFAFLSQSSVVDAQTFEEAPYLLGEREGRTIFSKDDEVFARGQWNPNLVTYDIVREGRPFTDPDTGELLGVESMMVGTATISSYNGDRAIMTIDTILREARVGDRLMPTQQLTIDSSYMPQPPGFEVDAAIASIGEEGRNLGGQYDTLVLNQGSSAGLQAGHLLVVQKPAVIVEDEVAKNGILQTLRHAVGLSNGRNVEYPGENIANVLIYRVYEHASLGLILSSTDAVSLEDRAVTP